MDPRHLQCDSCLEANLRLCLLRQHLGKGQISMYPGVPWASGTTGPRCVCEKLSLGPWGYLKITPGVLGSINSGLYPNPSLGFPRDPGDPREQTHPRQPTLNARPILGWGPHRNMRGPIGLGPQGPKGPQVPQGPTEPQRLVVLQEPMGLKGFQSEIAMKSITLARRSDLKSKNL